MKLVYAMVRCEESLGILKKIGSQIEHLNRYGIATVCFVGYSNDTKDHLDVFRTMLDGAFIQDCFIPLAFPIKTLAKSLYLRQYYRALGQYAETTRADLIFMRGYTAEWSIVRFLETHPKKVVFEINGNVRENIRRRKLYGRYLLNRLYAKTILRQARACITVTHELAEQERKIASPCPLETYTVSNGYAVDAVPLRHAPADGETLEMLFIANVRPWHGLDRVIEGLYRYRGNKRVCLHLVGRVPKDHLTFVQTRALGERVIFHGVKWGHELTALFDRCAIAIGALALFRNGLREASALKIREYLARGIPFVYQGEDTDIPKDSPIARYCLTVPSDESPIDVEELISFAVRMQADKEHPQKMRELAKQTIDMPVKMRLLSEILRDLQRESTR